MKYLILFFIFLINAGIMSAQVNQKLLLSRQQKQFVTSFNFSDETNVSLKEKFLKLNESGNFQDGDNVPTTDERAEAELNYAKTQSEGFKIGNEVYYFLGAAAVAAIIYFLIPDNDPSSQQNNTFGLPVTPQ